MLVEAIFPDQNRTSFAGSIQSLPSAQDCAAPQGDRDEHCGRYCPLGLILAFFGANLLFHFLPNPTLPSGPLRDFTTVMGTTHYLTVIGFFQLVPGLLLLVNRYVPLALTVAGGRDREHSDDTHSGQRAFPRAILVVISRSWPSGTCAPR